MDLAGKHSRTGKLYRTLGNSDSGLSFQVPSSELSAALNKGTSETLQEKEREQIMRALRECNGQPGGPGGAAARLGLKRTRGEERLTAYPQWAYPGLMTPRFKRILEAAVWFVAGFVTHLLMHYYHHVG